MDIEVDSTTTDSPIVIDDRPPVSCLTSDGSTIELSRGAAEMSMTINNLLSDIGAECAIPIPNVTLAVMTLFSEYAEYKLITPNPPKSKDPKDDRRTDDILPWDAEFVGKLQQSTLFELIMAANFLECKDLLDLCTKTVANMIKGKSIEELRTTFHIKNEFTPEEERTFREENAWCIDA